MNLNQLSHRSYIIDHITIVDPKKNTSFAGHLVVMDGKIDAVWIIGQAVSIFETEITL